jgi:spore coat polysaccharide biosynthesis protein SpsF (cytidylyltransferase family)
VLERYYRAAFQQQANQVVRITADCPLIDPQVIDLVIDAFMETEHAYVSNINPPTYPDGLDTEVFSFTALEQAWRDAKLRSEREHVTLYIRNHPELFSLGNVAHHRDLSGLRWVVDEACDLEFTRAIYAKLGDAPFVMANVLRLLEEEPQLAKINANITRNEGLLKSLLEDGVL